MTKEEKQKAIDALKMSMPIFGITPGEFTDYIQTLNKIKDWLEKEPCDDACCQEENASEPDAVSFKVDGDVVVKYEYTFGPRDGATKYKAKAVMTKEIFQECYEKWIKPQIRIVCDYCPREVKE